LRYLTVRTIGGTITALLISILMGPLIINFLKSMQFEQFVRKDGPKSHLEKSGTPTMGGLLIPEREPKVISVGLCHVGGFYLGVLV
jgi:phospho-N-acetylmuramoyl-pentapeptide-transferase